jgi:hypothetical protein
VRFTAGTTGDIIGEESRAGAAAIAVAPVDSGTLIAISFASKKEAVVHSGTSIRALASAPPLET